MIGTKLGWPPMRSSCALACAAWVFSCLIVPGQRSQAQDLKAGAAAAEFQADDSLVIGGGIGPGKATGQEGKLRACAVMVEDARGGKVCLVACDVLMIERDVLDRAAHEIERRTGVPFDAVLIN